MKNKLPFLLLLVTSHAFASGPFEGLDFNVNATEPRQYEYCDAMITSSTTIPAAAKYDVSKACQYGLDDARRMAERFGGGNGMIQGFFRGYAYGMHDSYEASSNDATAFQQGQAAIAGIGSYMESGLDEGIKKGQQEGNGDGSSEARVRFNAAVDTGILPNRNVTPKERAYTPMDNAYYSLVPKNEQVYTTINDIVKAHDERELTALNLRDFPVYSQYDATTWGETTRLSWWDLWFDNGSYIFSKALWFDDGKALETWLTRPIDTKPRYQALANVVVSDVAGQRINLQSVFHSAFREAYKYYVEYYFAKNFKINVTVGQLMGKVVGMELGKRVSFGRGLVNGFNKKFEESARTTYANAYKGAYMNSFNLTFDDYSKNPKLEFLALKSSTFMELMGMDDDGVVQPGEYFSLKFRMKNAGGVGANLVGSLNGDVLNAKAITGNINQISTKNFDTIQPVGQIDTRLESGTNADLRLQVNGAQTALSQYVTKLVKIVEAPTFAADTLKGSVTVSVAVKNVSKVVTPASVTAKVLVDGREVSVQNVGILVAGQTATPGLTISNIDPMTLINGQLKATVVLVLGDTVLEQKEMIIMSKNRTKDLVSYYAQIANGRGYIPSSSNQEDRLAQVASSVKTTNHDELQAHRKGDNIWKHNPDITVVGQLRLAKSLGNLTEDGKRNYDALARQMWTDKKILRSFLGIQPKRKAFKGILEQLTISGKL